MISTVKALLVTPIFSLESFADVLDLEVHSCRSAIDAVLNEQQYAGGESSALVQIVPLPLLIRSESYVHSYTRQMAWSSLEALVGKCKKSHIDPAPLPYLLGLLDQHPAALYKALYAGAHYIEYLCDPNPFSFCGPTGREHQLCLKRRHGRVILGLSEFVVDRKINTSERISLGSVRLIAFVPALVVVEDLSEKLIG